MKPKVYLVKNNSDIMEKSKIKNYNLFVNEGYENTNGILVMDNIANEPIGFILEPINIEEKLYDLVLYFSDDCELNIPSNLKPFDEDIIIKGKDLYHEKEIELVLKSISVY
jgi:hypothetical protein